MMQKSNFGLVVYILCAGIVHKGKVAEWCPLVKCMNMDVCAGADL